MTQTYDTTSGEVATFVDQLARTTTYLRDTMGRATTITYADTYNERFVYNSAGRKFKGVRTLCLTCLTTGSRDGRGFWTYFTLDGVGNATGTTDAKGNTTASAFDLASQVLTSRDQMGNWTDFTYNSRGWMTTTTDPLNNLWTTTFNAVGNVTSTDDPLGHGGATTYDALNRVSTSTDARGYVTTQTYWADGRAKDTTDPLGIVMRSDLDFTNKKYTTTNAYGIGAVVTTESNFDLAGQTTSSKDGLGHFTTYTKNSVGDTTAVTDALNHTMTYTVDAEGRTTKITDGLGKFTTLTVDLLGRQVKTFDAALGGYTTMLDPESNVVANVDGMANQTKNIYDQLGNLVLTIDALNGTTRREYDALSRLVAYTDPSGNKTAYEYNELSQLTKVTDPNAGTMTFVYDAAGRETSRADQLGRVKNFTYLDNNLLSTEVWKTSGTPVNTLTYSYSATSQLLTAADANGTISFTYDDLARQRSVTDVWGITLTNSYDAASRLTSVADELGGLREYTWDNGDRLTVEKCSDASAQLRLDFTYSVRDLVTQIDRYTDTAGTSLKSQTVYGLDDEGKALTITHKNSGGTTVDSFTYQYDLADRIMTETSTLGATKTYTYDRTSQVTGDGTTSYSWDANGNRNNAGYTTTTGNRLSTDGTYNFTYDAAGNETKKVKISNDETWVYAYDHNNRLTHAEKRATQNGAAIESIDFKYDIFGNRIERDYDSDGAGAAAAVVLKMAYENGNAWADLDNSLALTTRRVYTGGLDSLVARIDSGNNEDWYLTDVIGSVRDLVNSSGTLIDHIDYGSFGNITAETQPTASDRYKFTSREYEKEADIQYNRARYLQYGRWMSHDPLGFDAGDSNLYRYVRNHPALLIDPSGLQTVPHPRIEPGYSLKMALPNETHAYGKTAIAQEGSLMYGDDVILHNQDPKRGEIDGGGKLITIRGPGVFLGYSGAATNIRWIQFFKIEFFPGTRDQELVFHIKPSAPNVPCPPHDDHPKGLKTSGGNLVNYFLDVKAANTTPFMYDPKTGGVGGVSANISWMYDRPTYGSKFSNAMLKGANATLGTVVITFYDYAVDITTNPMKIKKEIAWRSVTSNLISDQAGFFPMNNNSIEFMAGMPDYATLNKVLAGRFPGGGFTIAK